MATAYLLPRWMQRLLSWIVQYIFLIIITAIILVPIVMLVFASLKTRGEVMTHPYTPPSPIRWENVQFILRPESVFWGMLRNSVIVMLSTTAGVIIICSLAAFVFARMEFKGRAWVYNFFLLGLMFPVTVAILPVYFVLRGLDQAGINLVDSLLGVIMVQVAFALSGNIMILRGFFTAVPAELQDAAYIDGCTVFDFFWRILLPLTRPALASVAAITMITSWNDLLIPLVVINSDKLWTLPLGTMQFQGQYGQDLAMVSAFVAISAIPTVLFYFFAERQIVSGLTAGAVKG